MKPYKVINNFLNDDYFKELQTTFTSNKFPWHYQPMSSNTPKGFDFDFMFTHNCYNFDYGVASSVFELIQPLIIKTGIEAGKSNLMRAKSNLYTNQAENFVHQKHTDYPAEIEYKTAVFNFTTCDGGTIFYIDGKEEFVESVENSIVIFDGPTEHAGVTQTNSNIRVLLNMDFNEGEYIGKY